MKLVFENKEIVAFGDAAIALNISRMTLHRWIVNGKIAAIKIGTYRAIPQSEIDRLNNDKR